MRHLGKTSAFRDSKGEVVPGSIAEVRYLNLGGVEQWVMIRGQSLGNPLLILLHGGPGISETHFFRRCNATLEKAFTVVYWDQRGAGRSFDRTIPRSSMTVERFIADLDELVGIACERVGTRKTVIFGHSWGSALGVLYASRFPDKVAAYVGSGQIGNSMAGEAASYAFALAEAEHLGNRKVVAKLRAIGPPPHTGRELLTERFCLSRIQGDMRPSYLWKTATTLFGAPEFSLLDLPNLRSIPFSINAMWNEVSRIDLTTQVPALTMPILFFLGRNDHVVPSDVSAAYFDIVKAPSKRLVWFEESGHEPFVDEPAKFNRAMVELVRPLAVETPAHRTSMERREAKVPSTDVTIAPVPRAQPGSASSP